MSGHVYLKFVYVSAREFKTYSKFGSRIQILTESMSDWESKVAQNPMSESASVSVSGQLWIKPRVNPCQSTRLQYSRLRLLLAKINRCCIIHFNKLIYCIWIILYNILLEPVHRLTGFYRISPDIIGFKSVRCTVIKINLNLTGLFWPWSNWSLLDGSRWPCQRS